MISQSSLVLTHLEGAFIERGSGVAADNVRRFIDCHNPGIYQLIESEGNDLLIPEGMKFSSGIGEVPDELARVLKSNAANGSKIILAGGRSDYCLKRTFQDLKALGLDFGVLLEGIYPIDMPVPDYMHSVPHSSME